MSEPQYQADVNGLASELRRAHGTAALEFAVRTAKEHIERSAWKDCAMWLQVVNRLNGGHPAHLSTGG